METGKKRFEHTEEFREDKSRPILIVDDSVEILDVLTHILTIGNYRVRIASSGQAAFESIADEIPSLILLDIKMPDMDGYEVCRRLKNDERTAGVPVILMSGFDDTARRTKCFNAGGVDFVTKPFQAEELLARIKVHL